MTVYATASELRTQINKDASTGTASDSALLVILEAVSQLIDRECNRPNGFVADQPATTKKYSGNAKHPTYLLIDECVSIDLVAVKESPTDTAYTSWVSTDWIAFSGDPEDPNYNDLPYTGIMADPSGSYDAFTDGRYLTTPGYRPTTGVARAVPTCQITARWGYALDIPPIVRQATLAQVAQWYKRGEAAWADMVATAELGSFGVATLDAQIKRMLEDSRMVKPVMSMR